jgi:hypothetical protein
MGDYLGKHIDEFSSFQRSIYKKYNDDGDKTWAYYYDSPAAPSRMDSFTIKRMTVFNLYTDRNGKFMAARGPDIPVATTGTTARTIG